MGRVRVGTACAVVVAAVAVAGARAGAPAGASAGSADATRVAVYLVRGERVAPLRRTLPRTAAVLRGALDALLRGPTVAERRAGYTSAIPVGAVLRGVALTGGVATIDLTGRYAAGGGSLSMLLRVAQIVHTATQFPTVRRVAFRIDGKPVAAISGEGVVVSPPVSRAIFEGQAPAILVEQPLPGDHVSSPILVRGTANVFEARLDLDLVTATGRLLTHRTLTASAGTGTRGRFQAQITLAARPGRIILVAYTHSAKNGARTNTVRIPLTLTR
jgi:Sporulation and spore germination/Immunoglobulin-like domain of bacterial spore germination